MKGIDKNMEKLVSIIVPTYNRRDTILKSIKSLLNQTYDNIEIIVVDDGSSDKTYRLFENYNNDKIKFFRYEQNKGACYARNYGVSKSTGKYIAFHDSDDEWLPEKLEKQMKKMLDGNYDFIFCGMYGIKHKRKYYIPNHKFNENKIVLYQQLYRNHISTQTMLMKREVFSKVKFDYRLVLRW